jgi:Holliday junction resolvase
MVDPLSRLNQHRRPMRFETFSALMDICRRWPFEYGKIIQLLLAISFDNSRGGYSVENRSSEGVDLEMIRGVKKFAIEVKTTEGSCVTLQDKDISGLKTKAGVDGYVPALAALRLHKCEDWVIANATRLRSGEYTLSRLSLDSIVELELLAKAHFESAVTEFRDNILSPPGGTPLNYLSGVLVKESQ